MANLNTALLDITNIHEEIINKLKYQNNSILSLSSQYDSLSSNLSSSINDLNIEFTTKVNSIKMKYIEALSSNVTSGITITTKTENDAIFTYLTLNIDQNEKVLDVSESGLFSNISLSAISPTASYLKSYALVGKNGQQLGNTVIDIPIDQVSLSAISPTAGYLKSYALVNKNGQQLGDTVIDIPKDQFLKDVEFIPAASIDQKNEANANVGARR